MSIPLPFPSQYECRDETLEVYASDRRGLVDYSFNNLGYRNNIDYNESDPNVGVYLGSSITAGIGIRFEDSFAALSSKELQVNCYHFGQGCMPVDNQELLRMLELVKASDLRPKYYVIQFIDLDRRYDFNTGLVNRVSTVDQNTDLFCQTFHKIETLLANDVWCFTGSDGSDCAIPDSIRRHPKCIGWNVPMVDLAGVNNHPGTKWHKIISAGIVRSIRKQLN